MAGLAGKEIGAEPAFGPKPEVRLLFWLLKNKCSAAAGKADHRQRALISGRLAGKSLCPDGVRCGSVFCHFWAVPTAGRAKLQERYEWLQNSPPQPILINRAIFAAGWSTDHASSGNHRLNQPKERFGITTNYNHRGSEASQCPCQRIRTAARRSEFQPGLVHTAIERHNDAQIVEEPDGTADYQREYETPPRDRSARRHEIEFPQEPGS